MDPTTLTTGERLALRHAASHPDALSEAWARVHREREAPTLADFLKELEHAAWRDTR